MNQHHQQPANSSAGDRSGSSSRGGAAADRLTDEATRDVLGPLDALLHEWAGREVTDAEHAMYREVADAVGRTRAALAARLAAQPPATDRDTLADQAGANALRDAANALRDADRQGYVFLGDGERVPWEDVARWLDDRAAALPAHRTPGRVSARNLAVGDAVRSQREWLTVERVTDEGDGGVFVEFVDFNQGRPIHFLNDVEFEVAAVLLAARPAPDTLADRVQADVWVAISDGTIECVAESREAATEALDARLARIGGTPDAAGWYQPQIPEYQDGSRWLRWYHNPYIVVGSRARSQEVRREPVRALVAGRSDASPEGGA